MERDRTRSVMLAAAALVAFAIGLTLPDIDLPLHLGHRSALTHSVLPVAVALRDRRWRQAAAGLAGGVGVHLSADCFPRAMMGYATVKVPFEGSIGAAGSYAWLAINAALALGIAAWTLRRLHHPLAAIVVAVGAAAVGVRYLWSDPGGWPVLALVVAGGVIWWRRQRARAD